MNEMTNELDQVQQIKLKDFWDVLVKRFVIVLLVAVIAFAAFYVFDQATFDPLYSSTSMLYILRQNEEFEDNSSDTMNEINIASRVVNDCSHMIKSRTVVEAVIEELQLDMRYGELYNMITVNNPKDTRVLEIIVQAQTPELAKQISDALRVRGQARITELMGFEQVRDYEPGTINTEPSNKTDPKLYVLVGLAAAVLTYGVFLVIFITDDRIRTDEDIERLLGLSVLSDVPDFNSQHKKQKYYRGYYKYRYGKYRYGKYRYGKGPKQEVADHE